MDEPLLPAHEAATSSRGAEQGQGAHDEVLVRIGQLTRNLHDNLRALGFDKLIEKAAHEMPDARDRLGYVAKMTEQAAQRVLNATDAAMPLQEKIDAGATDLAASWQSLLQEASSEQRYRDMAARTLAYLEETKGHAGTTRQELLSIMMAQDFQDLTGQVIRKVTELAHGIEQQLVQLLIDYSPSDVRPDVKREAGSGLLNGPQIKPHDTPDVVADQGQVDDLLESLGF